jgi:hypothetical protein
MLSSGGSGGGSGPGPGAGGSDSQQIASWVEASCRKVPGADYGGASGSAGTGSPFAGLGGGAGTLYACSRSS